MIQTTIPKLLNHHHCRNKCLTEHYNKHKKSFKDKKINILSFKQICHIYNGLVMEHIIYEGGIYNYGIGNVGIYKRPNRQKVDDKIKVEFKFYSFLKDRKIETIDSEFRYMFKFILNFKHSFKFRARIEHRRTLFDHIQKIIKFESDDLFIDYRTFYKKFIKIRNFKDYEKKHYYNNSLSTTY